MVAVEVVLVAGVMVFGENINEYIYICAGTYIDVLRQRPSNWPLPRRMWPHWWDDLVPAILLKI